jgi:hypothetical protein
MNCPTCQERMRCKFTYPVGKASRFRVYRCSGCKAYKETIEIDTLMLPPTTEEIRTLTKGIQEAKAKRFFFGKQKGAAVTAPSTSYFITHGS